MQTRTTLLLDKDVHSRFKATCKALGCTQADFIAAVTSDPNIEALKPVLDAYLAVKKLDGRTVEAALIAKLKALPPEQRKVELERLAAAVQA